MKSLLLTAANNRTVHLTIANFDPTCHHRDHLESPAHAVQAILNPPEE